MPDSLASAERLAEIKKLDPFGDDVAPLLQSAIDRVRYSLGIDLAMVNVLLDGTQVAIAQSGNVFWPTEDGPVTTDGSFCTHTVLIGQPFIATDTINAEAFRRNPDAEAGYINAYLGVPLISGGQSIGAVCAISGGSRGFDDEDVQILTEAAVEILGLLDARSNPAN